MSRRPGGRRSCSSPRTAQTWLPPEEGDGDLCSCLLRMRHACVCDCVCVVGCKLRAQPVDVYVHLGTAPRSARIRYFVAYFVILCLKGLNALMYLSISGIWFVTFDNSLFTHHTGHRCTRATRRSRSAHVAVPARDEGHVRTPDVLHTSHLTALTRSPCVGLTPICYHLS